MSGSAAVSHSLRDIKFVGGFFSQLEFSRRAIYIIVSPYSTVYGFKGTVRPDWI